jgi:hypothetical protein
MENNLTPMLTYTSAEGMTYSYTLERKSRVAYAEFMNPTSKYEKVYYQVNVFHLTDRTTPINFAFVDNPTDTVALQRAIEEVIEWYNTPSQVLASMHSPRD